jgi:predicted alpha/beta superfamily hydrolase
MLQGFGGNDKDVLGLGAALSKSGINVLTIINSGVTPSEGLFSFDNSIKDMEAAHAFVLNAANVEQFKIDTASIIVGGLSFGGGIAMTYAIKHPEIKYVISIAGNDWGAYFEEYANNPVLKERVDANIDQRISSGQMKFEQGAQPAEMLSTGLDKIDPDLYLKNNAKKLTPKDILLIGGWDDHVVSIDQYILPLYRALQKENAAQVRMEAFEDNHSFIQSSKPIAEVIIDWAKNILNPEPQIISHVRDMNIKIGHRDNVQSKILNENRNLVISLPEGYETSGQNYPVLYLLDGNVATLSEALVVTHKLEADMIIVAIPNTDRDRDMMPLSAPSYEVKNPGAVQFLSFIEKELIPYIDDNYRTNKERTIRGKSLSGLFVMYAFLAKPELFSNYIGNCAGWFADMDTFFNALADQAFQNKDRFNVKKLFVANSLADPLDPNGEIHQAMLDFSKKLKSVLGDSIKFRYATYEDAGHVPYSGFYDGMRYVLEVEKK